MVFYTQVSLWDVGGWCWLDFSNTKWQLYWLHGSIWLITLLSTLNDFQPGIYIFFFDVYG